MLTGSDDVTGSELSACVRSGWSTEVGLEVSGVGLRGCEGRVVGCGGGGREGRVSLYPSATNRYESLHCMLSTQETVKFRGKSCTVVDKPQDAVMKRCLPEALTQKIFHT